jgi:calcineurin-like phosphoesterase family protein
MDFITSDLHLGHANIAGPNTSQWKQGYRNFSSVQEMDYKIIENINEHVKQDDTLWMLGDFSFGGHTKIPDYRRRIYCKNIHIIRGNHDHHIAKYAEFFSSIQDTKYVWLYDSNGVKHPWVFCHYAMRIWEGSHKGYFHGYGHSHASLEHTEYGKSMDFGIDNAYRLLGEYRPFSVDEGVKILSKRPIEFPDHHSSETNVK